ncbi:chemotaxis protein CheA [Aliikangiella maris]|uniref:Chemotaxis protein CheA n=2 Tax=Aliikangiella maris TaxID=3162458 RepID=A0ABV2BT20_9GAMM
MEIDLSQFHQVFFEESLEGLDTMEEKLLNLEADSDLEIINTIFRAAHSIKGGSATFNFKEVAEFTHVMETLLDEMRSAEREVTRELIDLLLRSVDCLRGMLNRIQQNEAVGESHTELVNQFHELLGEDSDSTAPSTKQTSQSSEHSTADKQQVTIANDESELHPIWQIDFKPKPYILETGNEPLRMFRELKSLGHLESTVVLTDVPEFNTLKAESCYVAWRLLLDAHIEENDIREVFEWVEDDCDLSITQVDSSALSSHEVKTAKSEPPKTSSSKAKTENVTAKTVQASPGAIRPSKAAGSKNMVHLKRAQQAETAATANKPNISTSIRVGTDKVDKLIDLVGELVITQSMLSELGENFNMGKLNQLIAGLVELEQNTRELQESVMRIRMLPIGFIFNRLPRMVRDLSSQLGKKVNLQISGESTELDKTVMEQIGDPLTHLVRNALDHGLENSEKRLQAGKSEEGNLNITAYHQGGNIVIEVADDGGGIDPDVIYQKAVDKGLIVDGSELSHDQILSLIMEPGFSTAAVVSDVSGRGVGMDVVKRNINNLGGSVEIESELGSGTTFIIRLPLTLAILDGQLIKVASEVYVLPLVSIIESVPLAMAEVSRIAGDMPVYKLDGDYIPVINLRKEFEIEASEEGTSEGLLAIVEGENKKIALLIDELLGQQQVVIKSLESHYKTIIGVSGATILGDGRVSLILDIVGMAKRAADRAKVLQKNVA